MTVRRKPRLWNIYEKDVPKDAVNIMRGTPWGNPHPITPECDRERAIARYVMNADYVFIQAAWHALRGRDLVCCCAPRPCHGDFLIKIANMRNGCYRIETENWCAGFVFKDGRVIESAPILHRILKRRPGAWMFIAERVCA